MEEASSSSGKKHGEVDEKGLTMLEVLEVEQELEDDANAVLGGSDDQHCTYSRGYVKRQALYACTTCIPANVALEKKGGMCLACSYHCHEGHELVELYTKRNFRCDCGNNNYPNKCTLQPEKDASNKENSYNDNFIGIYCTCKRPYPDPDDDVDDEMIQCIMCEDWFHGRHLGNTPPSGNYSEMICSDCMTKHSFLKHYLSYSVGYKDGSTSENEAKEKQKETSNAEHSNEGKEDSSKGSGGVCSNKDAKLETKDFHIERDDKETTVGDSKESAEVCKIENWKACPSVGASYWTQSWRKILCTCQKCKDMYNSQKVSFLLDEDDPVQVYEEEGKAKDSGGSSQYEEGLRALSSLGHVQKVDAIQEYNMMQTHLKNYLKKFADSKKVVREEDIREFFSEMESRKKQRLEVHVPHFCH